MSSVNLDISCRPPPWLHQPSLRKYSLASFTCVQQHPNTRLHSVHTHTDTHIHTHKWCWCFACCYSEQKYPGSHRVRHKRSILARMHVSCRQHMKVKCQSLHCVRLFVTPRTYIVHHDLFQGIFLTQGSNLGLMHCRQTVWASRDSLYLELTLLFHSDNFCLLTGLFNPFINITCYYWYSWIFLTSVLLFVFYVSCLISPISFWGACCAYVSLIILISRVS